MLCHGINGEPEILATRPPFHRVIPVESHPIIWLHVFLPHSRHHYLHRRRRDAPPPPKILRRPVPLGPVPALHSLAMSLISVTIFIGMLLSAEAEVRDTRWLWQRTRTTPLEWFLCFPLGIRPSGRVFFWSYAFYLSRFLHLLRTFFIVLRNRKLWFFRLFNHSMLLVMSFLWLEFLQSFQVLAILFSTGIYTAVYGYRFWVEMGLPVKNFWFALDCQMVLLGCNLVCHFGVILLHYLRGGCNGIGAWVFNSVLNVAILLHFLRNYVNSYWQRKVKHE